MAKATLIKGSVELGLIHYHHIRKHGGIQADMALRQYLRALHPETQAERKRERERDSAWCGLLKSKSTLSGTPPPTRPHLLINHSQAVLLN